MEGRSRISGEGNDLGAVDIGDWVPKDCHDDINMDFALWGEHAAAAHLVPQFSIELFLNGFWVFDYAFNSVFEQDMAEVELFWLLGFHAWRFGNSSCAFDLASIDVCHTHFLFKRIERIDQILGALAFCSVTDGFGALIF